MTSGLILLQLFILAKEMEGRSLQGNCICCAKLRPHFLASAGWSRVAFAGSGTYGEGGKCPCKRGQHESSLANSGDNTLNPGELFLLQVHAQSEKNTAALSKEMVAGCATVPSWCAEESMVQQPEV